LISQLVAVHLPELGSIQRLKHVADQIALSSSFQILAADPCLGCIFSTPQDQAPRQQIGINTCKLFCSPRWQRLQMPWRGLSLSDFGNYLSVGEAARRAPTNSTSRRSAISF
jgi:hypothetical protein